MALIGLCDTCICPYPIWLIGLIALYGLKELIVLIAYRLRQVSSGKQSALRSS